MWPLEIKCRDCENTISRWTARRTSGRCPDCLARAAERDAEFKAEVEAANRAFERRLATGEVFRPSTVELDSAMTPIEFRSPAGRWTLQPDFYGEYREGRITTIDEAIRDAESRADGMLFLVSNHDGQLNVGLSANYGVCEYVNEQRGHWCYAYTDDNLKHQVQEQQHVIQSCPCCGVGMLWYPSRFHLPRVQALELARRIVRGECPGDVSWLDSGDFSHTERGRG